MNREIKFRGKRLSNGAYSHQKAENWIYGYCVIVDGVHYIIPMNIKSLCIPMGIELVMVDPETVGQFTGLKDKNGKEIYEGDIIHGTGMAENWKWAKENDYWGIVIDGDVNMPINGGEYSFNYSGIYAETGSNPNEYMTEELAMGNVYVIGNIYENPELLR